jgi:hypothetical protein
MATIPASQSYRTEEDRIFRNMHHRVAIAWFQHDIIPGAHVSLAVDGILKGYRCATAAIEPSSLKSAIEKAKYGRAEKFTILRIMPITVTDEGYQILKKWKERSFYPCTTCMHAVARILAATTSIHIPFFIAQSPSLSELYLRKLHEKGAKELGYTHEYKRGMPPAINPDLLPGAVCTGIEALATLGMTAAPITLVALPLLSYLYEYTESDTCPTGERLFEIAYPFVMGAITLLTCKQLWDTRHYAEQHLDDSPLAKKGWRASNRTKAAKLLSTSSS